ncbi:MAG: hypothetical protein WBQ89_17440 [Candidatus Acidiferrum sp.]
MANMLLMTAFEVGNPIEVFILMKSHNFTGDSGHACSHGFHMEPTGRGVNVHSVLPLSNVALLEAPTPTKASTHHFSFEQFTVPPLENT